MKQKRVPMRMCSGCGEMFDKRELIRVVKSPENEISIDMTGKKPGRGAYLCKSLECFKKAKKARRFERAFSQQICADVFESMEKELEKSE